MTENLQHVEKCTAEIAEKMEQGYNRELPEEVSGKITEFNGLLALSGRMVALTEMIHNDELGKLAEQYKDSKLGATDKKMIFAGRLKKEIYYMTYADRLNRGLTHALDSLRSQLSYLKTEFSNSNMTN